MRTAKSGAFTIFVVPDRDGVSRRFRISQKLIYALALCGIASIGFLSAFLIHYVYVIDEVFANTLRRHNDALVAELGSLKEDVSNMEHHYWVLTSSMKSYVP